MKKYPVLLALSAFGLAPLLQGATFFDDFATLGQNPNPSTPGQNLNTYNSWSSGNGQLGDPLAFGYTIGSPASNAAAVGPFFDAPSNATTSFSASHALLTPLAGSTLLTTFVIVDSDPVGGFPARNDYSINISSGVTTLFSLSMLATNQTQPSDPAQWNLSAAGNPFFTTAQENGLYNLSVFFTPSGLDMNYTVNIAPAGGGGGFSTSGTLAGLAGAVVDQYSVTTRQGGGSGWGSGLIGIDNVGVVPEPSSVLLLGLASLGLIRRRRA